MGTQFSVINKCNYQCPICRLSGNTPNIAGKFFIINDQQCQCNACGTIYKITDYYYPYIHNNDKTETNITL